MASSVEQVVEALRVLYSDPSSLAKEKANQWLSQFQKSEEAWSVAQLILFAPDAPIETKQFAAQTFKIKITYDLDSLPAEQRLALRDSLLTALRSFAAGPRIILSQICIALADLALQLTAAEWSDPITSMIDSLGKEPTMASALLGWLGAMAEEYNGNLKLTVNSDFGRRGNSQHDQVIALLSMYSQAPGITTELQNLCYTCLATWLRTGQAPAVSLAGSAILNSVFASLADPALFDSAVDCLVDIIHETQELDDNMRLIEELVPKLINLRPLISTTAVKEDGDTMRGYTRIFVEAGEWYEPIILRHQDAFLPLVEAIAECSAYDDLDVVDITLNFWYKLAKGIRSTESLSPALTSIWASLVETIIKHLHYPDEEITGQERDDFKAFRHTIGDTLKDCCAVLGATACLARSFEMMYTALNMGPNIKWQDIEAPLFSMRSMGAEVDPREDEIMPQMMSLLPQLPPHPKIRYAAILVMGRYTQWLDQHPDHIQFQLPYISSAFADADSEVSAAAAQTMKYLCKDCSHHLVAYLPQLQTFFQSVTGTLGAEDLLDLTAAIGHVIAAMPANEGPQALSLFCMPNVELVQAVVVKEATTAVAATRGEIQSACEALERIDMLLAIVGPYDDGLPESCRGVVEQVWTILDAFLAKYGSLKLVGEKVCVCVRRGLSFFEESAFAVSTLVLERMARCFELSAASSYLWVTGKLVVSFGKRRDPAFDAVLKNVFERETTKVFVSLQETTPALLADVLDDYVHVIADLIEYSPHILLLSPAFPTAFQAILSSLTLLSPAILLSTLDAVRSIIGHESLCFDPTDPSYNLSAADTALYPAFATAIRSVVEPSSLQLVELLVNELVSFSEDTGSNVLTIFRVMSIAFPATLNSTVPVCVSRIGEKLVDDAGKTKFVNQFNLAMAEQNPGKVKDAFVGLLRTSQKNRERARLTERV